MPEPLKMTSAVRLDDLIDVIRRVHTDPLDQLSDAMLASEHLGEVADHLVGHFVDQARRSGASWAEIGRSMGVSKQAVQQRFVTKVADSLTLDPESGFSRFTVRARNTVMAAQDEARAAANPTIAPAHLLLGLLKEPEGLAAKALGSHGATDATVRAALATLLPAPVDDVPDLIPYDAEARCLGCMTYGVPERGAHPWTLDEDESRPLIRQAVEAGINFFDTANAIPTAPVEEIVGRALRDFARRDEIVLPPRCALRAAGPNVGGLSRKAICTRSTPA
jgi:hypothetical protein